MQLFLFTDALLTPNEREGIEAGNANYTEATISAFTKKPATLQNDKNSYYVGTHINIDQNFGFNYSTIYEEIFHAGKKTYYLTNNIPINNITLEVEAKFSKIQSFYLSNLNLSAKEMKSEMQKKGFFGYEMDFLFNGDEYDKTTTAYFKGGSLSVTALSTAYDEVIKFSEAVKDQYKKKNPEIVNEVLIIDFKFNDKLQKDAEKN